MKKLSIIATGLLSLGCLCADDNAAVKTMEWQSKLSGNIGMKFETEHVYHGRKEITSRTFVTSAEVSYQLFDAARAYVGTEAALRTKDSGINDIAPYIGCMYHINDIFAIDAGYTHHFWGWGFVDDDGYLTPNTNEIYTGLLINVFLSPSLYYEYDFDWEEINVVATARYSFDLSQYAISGLCIDLGAKIGYDRAGKPYGFKYNKDTDGDKDYVYCGLNADLIYSTTASTKARAGVAYEGNSAKRDAWANGYEPHNMIWFNASVDCAF